MSSRKQVKSKGRGKVPSSLAELKGAVRAQTRAHPTARVDVFLLDVENLIDLYRSIEADCAEWNATPSKRLSRLKALEKAVGRALYDLSRRKVIAKELPLRLPSNTAEAEAHVAALYDGRFGTDSEAEKREESIQANLPAASRRGLLQITGKHVAQSQELVHVEHGHPI